MKYDGDAFISYAHLDNVGLAEGHKGWVEGLQRALEIRVGQLLGKHTEIWWDPKLQGNDVFAETLVDRLRSVAALISVVSPRYVRSEWGRRELVAFVQAAQEQGGVNIGDKSRLFKVLKTPVPLEEHPPELQTLLGYEFFRTDPATGKVRELNEIFGPEAERDFWLRLDDLAHDVCRLLEVLEDLAAETPKTTSADDAAYLPRGDHRRSARAPRGDQTGPGTARTYSPSRSPAAAVGGRAGSLGARRPCALSHVDSHDWPQLQPRPGRRSEVHARVAGRSRGRARDNRSPDAIDMVSAGARGHRRASAGLRAAAPP